ncbi:MAG: hypothetical protein WCT28_03305 [Patescibacteria group bacterium]
MFLVSLAGCGDPIPPVPATAQQIDNNVVLTSVHALDMHSGCANEKGEIDTFCLASVMWDVRQEVVLSEPCGNSCLEWYARTNEFLRNELRSPEKLGELYRTIELMLWETIGTSDSAQMIRKYLKDVVIPTFTKEASNQLRWAYVGETSSWNVNQEKTDNAILQKARLDDLKIRREAFRTLALQENFPNPYLLQWRLRREAEGGGRLVKTYANIAERLLKKLEAYKLHEEAIRQTE